MPETILSRLQRYDFRRIPYLKILERLQDLAGREGVEVEESALRLLAREAGGSMRDAERMLETAIATSSGKVTEAEVASSLGVASRTTVLKLADAILQKNAAAALAHVRELASRGANLESLGRDLLETIRNLAVAKLPAGDSDSPLDDIPDHEVAELKRLAAGASARDIMRLFRLMADSQEQILRSPYPDLLLEMAVVRMASLAAVIDADELLRAIGSATPPASGTPPASSGGGSGSRGGAKPEPAPSPQPSGARRLRVEGEVKADAPLRSEHHDDGPRELPELRDFIRGRRAALAGFMEQGAGLDSRRRHADGHRAQRHLHPLSERQQDGNRGACERASRPRDSRRAVDQRRGEVPRRAAPRCRWRATAGRARLPAATAPGAYRSTGRGSRTAQKKTAPSRPVESIREIAPASPAIEACAAPRHRKNGRRCLRIPRCGECSIRWTRGWWS